MPSTTLINPLSSSAYLQGKIPWLLAALFLVVIVLEYSTPPLYVFGYLYIGAVLIASNRLGRRVSIWVTTIAVGLTLLNLIVPGKAALSSAAIANRLIAILALIVTAWLSDRIKHYEAAITQQQLKIAAQEELTRVRQDFIATLAHDLKTPLLGAIETLKALQTEGFGPTSPDQRKVLAVITRSHQKTLQLVETLMDVYRNDAEGLVLAPAPVDLFALAEDAIADMTALAAARQIHLRLHQPASDFRRSYWVHGDAFQLARVFTNLIANAVNHSLRGRAVEIELSDQPRWHRVQVIDTGVGIRPDELPHLFDRFYQGQSDRQIKGTGLGLYLSRQIIEAHGGRIWAAPHLPQGAIFAFELPSYGGSPSPPPLAAQHDP